MFARPAGYDPRTDPIVRVDARRLRSRLADYYQGPGAADSVIIELPRGTYVPTFTLRECTTANQPPEELPLPAASLPGRQWPGRHWPRRPWLRFVPPVALALILAGGLAWALRHRQPPQGPPTIAVLPFANLSADSANEIFSDGLTDELIGALSRVPGLRVVGRGVVFRHKNSKEDVQGLARQWGANTVLEGSVRREGQRLRITATLTNVEGGLSLWSETWDRDAQDIFAIQQDIATAIVRSLRLRLGPQNTPVRTTSVEAYNEYLSGRYEYSRFTGDGFDRARIHLEQAIAIDPKYAPARTLLAVVFNLSGYYNVMPGSAAFARARQVAEEAVRMDPNSGEAHAALAMSLGIHDWNWKRCEEEARKAIELAPGAPEPHALYAVSCLMPQGRLDEAIAEYRRSLEIDPLQVFPSLGLAFTFLAAERYPEAVEQYRRTLDINPSFSDIWWDSGMAYALSGNPERAAEMYRKADEVRGRTYRPDACALALMGRIPEAREAIMAWEKRTGGKTEEALDVARAWGAIGDVAQTVRWTERAWTAREPELVWLKIDPRFRKVRQAPEFQNIIRRLGL